LRRLEIPGDAFKNNDTFEININLAIILAFIQYRSIEKIVATNNS